MPAKALARSTRRIRAGLLLTALSCLFSLSAGPALADPVKTAIERAEKQEPLEAIRILEAAEQALPNTSPASLSSKVSKVSKLSSRHADLLAELSLRYALSVDYYALKKQKREAEAAARKALEIAERAVAKDDRSARAHLAIAVAYGKLAAYVDNGTKMKFSVIIRKESERTLELNPKEDFAHHILGRWHYSIATLNPMARMAARAIYGKVPEGSLDTGIAHLEKAAALNPSYAPHQYRLAAALEAAGREADARPHWQAVLRLPAHDQDDRRAQRAARRALGL